MDDYIKTLQGFIADLRIAISLLTRVPLASKTPVGDGDVARASWALPVAGLLIGLAGALAYWLASRAHLLPEPAAALALAVTLLLTGAMHEDGLADTADGFGGGQSREQKLAIMRDSRIGTYGACALGISLLLRWSALAAIAEPGQVATALIVAHTSARAGLPLFMQLVPPARSDGLSTSVGQPPSTSIAVALALGAICLLFGLGPAGAIIGSLILLAAGLSLAWLARKQIGGQTGDVLGTLEQVSEAAVLLLAASLFSG
jgi:adenosylcobinamide-GDP ribazoletransferase